jgi:hypothetical protein
MTTAVPVSLLFATSMSKGPEAGHISGSDEEQASSWNSTEGSTVSLPHATNRMTAAEKAMLLRA